MSLAARSVVASRFRAARPIGGRYAPYPVIDVRLLRTDPNGVRAAMARRHAPELLDQLDAAASLDTRLRDLAAERDGLRRRVNELSRDVGQLRAAGEVDKAEAMMAESRTLGDRERALADQTTRMDHELREILLR